MYIYQNNNDNFHVWYCKVYLHYVKDIDKVKMDYSLYEVKSKGENKFVSVNSEETFDILQYHSCKFGLVKKVKLKDGIHYSFLIGNETDDFIQSEKTILPKIKKYITPRLFFKLRFKKFFLDRIEQILSEYE